MKLPEVGDCKHLRKFAFDKMNAWSSLSKKLPSVKHYAGAGRYQESDRDQSEWDSLDEVLTSTKRGSSIDFVVGKD